ncbi:unnamed protein product [Didymodactylos carnosus]|uniref:Neurotransmitter-gated ion-channel ligand-binding domain-containing protein n=1 Tax=Didymodactylos carnosus TaxID=1234261 RepID=A0A814K3Q6_9BILA|nr:unnamed protein product [Didymodactylos carnosus]CAF3815725.1 unnamed protein product [Didymodactylos carnosus]
MIAIMRLYFAPPLYFAPHYLSCSAGNNEQHNRKGGSTKNKKQQQTIVQKPNHQKELPLKRGQRSRMKKMKEKYADQDDEDREIRMKLLCSAGSNEQHNRKGGSKKNKKKQQTIVQKPNHQVPPLSTNIPKPKPLPPRQLKESGGDTGVIVEEVIDDEDEQEKNKAETDDYRLLSTITGQPVTDDPLIYVIPVCAPVYKVEIYVIYCKLTTVNTVLGKYDAEIDVVSSWFINTSDKITTYDPDTHWNPQLVFDNVIGESKIRTRFEVEHETGDDGRTRIIQYQKISATFSEAFKIFQYALKLIRSSIAGVLITTLHTTSSIRLIGKQEYSFLAYKAVLENQIWDFNQTVFVQETIYQEQTHYLKSREYPRLRFNAIVARKSQFYVINLLLPLFFVTSTIFVSFAHDSGGVSSRISACATTLLTEINFRFIIHNYLPNVPYLTSLDIYSMASIMFIVMVFGWHAFAGKYLKHIPYGQLDSYVVLTSASIYILAHIVFGIFGCYVPRQKQKRALNTKPTLFVDTPILIETNNPGYEHTRVRL